ncbi:MAG: chorismate--pyruvate lyase [Legionellales bacterium]|nr:chorismate--pyruvate lyase [Legionellales bacterium]|tara:strand:+ start:9485 stop:10108 length:624 start_codon:yes stop_codon:yes gene_type:complete
MVDSIAIIAIEECTLKTVTANHQANNSTCSAKWLYHWELSPFALPRAVRDWALYRDSMTQRLKQASETFRVQILKQQWQRPSNSEALLLGLMPASKVLARDVHLICNDEVWVAGHSIIPWSSLWGKLRYMQGLLDNRPLGEILFRNPTLKRGEFQVALLKPEHSEYQWAVRDIDKPPEELWGRRSLFYLHGKSLMVSEVFFPEVLTR